jgi:MarR family transcriptional regulator, transcriptional regulator for hemolysin
VQRVELTEAGDAAFQRLRRAASSFDQRLRFGLDDGDIQRLRELLAQLLSNVTGHEASAEERPMEGAAAS